MVRVQPGAPAFCPSGFGLSTHVQRWRGCRERARGAGRVPDRARELCPCRASPLEAASRPVCGSVRARGENGRAPPRLASVHRPLRGLHDRTPRRPMGSLPSSTGSAGRHRLRRPGPRSPAEGRARDRVLRGGLVSASAARGRGRRGGAAERDRHPARLRGGRSLLLNGHLDTVGVGGMEAPFEPRLDEGRLTGAAPMT